MLNLVAIITTLPVMRDVTPGSLEAILGDITSILSSIISWVTSVITMVTGNPLILLFVVIGVGLIAIGVVRRLLRL